MESLFEKELKGENGCRIFLVDEEGQEKTELASVPVKNGKDVKLTIDAGLQTSLYQAFQKDKSCSVAMNPDTGEVLALLSTPSYDNNAFILGLSEEQWNELNKDEEKPLYNRFRQIWCPGSSFKPVVVAIGLESGAIDPEENEKGEGLHWQKDSSWGSYYVTTLHTYEPVNLENALIYSDNIYFAKAALKIGAGRWNRLWGPHGGCDSGRKNRNRRNQSIQGRYIRNRIRLACGFYSRGRRKSCYAEWIFYSQRFKEDRIERAI